MQILNNLIKKVAALAKHEKAPVYLAAVSFTESSVFPVPPDFMLAPMAIAKPNKAYQYSLIATISSILGAIVGYMLGMFLFLPIVEPLLKYFNYYNLYLNAVDLFSIYGFLAVLIAGLTPIPYKLVTIAAGALNYSVAPFILASIIARGLRFYSVALTCRSFNKHADKIFKLLDNVMLASTIAILGVGGIFWSFYGNY